MLVPLNMGGCFALTSTSLVLLLRGPSSISHLDTQFDRVGPLGFKDMINFLQVQFAGFGKGKVGYNKLDEVVADIDGPDLVSDLINANRDTVVVYNTSSTLEIFSIITRREGA